MELTVVCKAITSREISQKFGLFFAEISLLPASLSLVDFPAI